MVLVWLEDVQREAESQESYQIAENVEVTEDAFEDLLKMPAEEAVEITHKMRVVAQWHAAHPEQADAGDPEHS